MQPSFYTPSNAPPAPTSQAGNVQLEHHERKGFTAAAKEVLNTARSSKRFRIHAWAAFAVTTASFITWAFLAMFYSMFPWFVFAAFLSAMTLSFHYFFFEKPQSNMLTVHFAWFLCINTMVIVTNFAVNPKSGWFFPVILALTIPLAVHWAYETYKDTVLQNIATETAFFLSLNAFCLSLWIYLGGGFPWFIYVFYVASIPLALHSNWIFHKEETTYALRNHVALFLQLNMMFFFTWLVTGMGFPWFFFVFVGWSLVLAGHFYLERRKQRRANLQTAPVSIPTTVATASTPSFTLGSDDAEVAPADFRTMASTTVTEPENYFDKLRAAQPTDPRYAEASV